MKDKSVSEVSYVKHESALLFSLKIDCATSYDIGSSLKLKSCCVIK